MPLAWGPGLGARGRGLGPGAQGPGLGARGLGPGAWGLGPRARGLGPGAWGPGPGLGARGPGPGAWGPGLGARGPRPGAWGPGLGPSLRPWLARAPKGPPGSPRPGPPPKAPNGTSPRPGWRRRVAIGVQAYDDESTPLRENIVHLATIMLVVVLRPSCQCPDGRALYARRPCINAGQVDARLPLSRNSK